MEDLRCPIVIAARVGVASRAREVVARVVLPLFDFGEALYRQFVPFVSYTEIVN
jgi:hypothetical protein